MTIHGTSLFYSARSNAQVQNQSPPNDENFILLSSNNNRTNMNKISHSENPICNKRIQRNHNIDKSIMNRTTADVLSSNHHNDKNNGNDDGGDPPALMLKRNLFGVSADCNTATGDQQEKQKQQKEKQTVNPFYQSPIPERQVQTLKEFHSPMEEGNNNNNCNNNNGGPLWNTPPSTQQKKLSLGTVSVRRIRNDDSNNKRRVIMAPLLNDDELDDDEHQMYTEYSKCSPTGGATKFQCSTLFASNPNFTSVDADGHAKISTVTKKKDATLPFDEISPTDVTLLNTNTPSSEVEFKRKKAYDELHQLHAVVETAGRNDRPSSTRLVNAPSNEFHQIPPQSVMKKKARKKMFLDSNNTSSQLPSSSLPNTTIINNHNYNNNSNRFDDDFELLTTLGSGSFGMVYKAKSRLDGCMYAIKAAHNECRSRNDRERMLMEVYALAALSDLPDPSTIHIVRYHQAWMQDNRLYIQNELCSSSLLDLLRMNYFEDNVDNSVNVEKENAKELKKFKLLREMLLALKLVHEHGMVHLDIKPENIFVKNDDQFKLGDFGLANSATTTEEVEEGDSRYMSRELLLGGGNQEDLTKSDIFSLGITMYEVCSRKKLPANGQQWQDLRNGLIVFDGDGVSPTSNDMQQIVRQMMCQDFRGRPSAVELLGSKKQLMSQEQRQLIIERNKVAEANLALNAQHQKMLKHLKPAPAKRGLKRFNTWSASGI